MHVPALVVAGLLVLASCAARPVAVSPPDPALAPNAADRSCSYYHPLFVEILRSNQCSIEQVIAADLDADGDPELLLAVRTTPLQSAMGRVRVEHLLVTRRADGRYERRLRLEDDPNLAGPFTATHGASGTIELSAHVIGFHCTAIRQAHLEIAGALARVAWDEPPSCAPEHYTEALPTPDAAP